MERVQRNLWPVMSQRTENVERSLQMAFTRLCSALKTQPCLLRPMVVGRGGVGVAGRFGWEPRKGGGQGRGRLFRVRWHICVWVRGVWASHVQWVGGWVSHVGWGGSPRMVAGDALHKY